MGNRKNEPSDQHGADASAVFDDDLLTMNVHRKIDVPAEIADEADIERLGFVPATAEGLQHVVPGCFVLVRLAEGYCWAEVLAITGETVLGRRHGELSNYVCPVECNSDKAIFFRREHIKALGCERYCWC